MMAIIDNDILLKGSCYGLLDELTSTISSAPNSMGVLGAARFVISKKIEKKALKGSTSAALARFVAFLTRAETLEPTPDEQNMAADLEFIAQGSAVSLDVGESQLCAILVHRMLPLLLTGDKRAIAAIESLLDSESRLLYVCGKVKCLEQLVSHALEGGLVDRVRYAVCAEPEIDTALSICFSCMNAGAPLESYCEGLGSYIKALRASAPRVLAP